MTKTDNLVLTLFAACLLLLPGCKREPSPPPGTMTMLGVNVDLPRLEQEFQNASPDLQKTVQDIKVQCRTWNMAKMVISLDALSKNPTLTDSQKKAVNDLIDQAGQVIAKQQNPGGR